MKGLVLTPNRRLCQTACGSVAGCGCSGAGFTLIEILVVSAITVMISGFLVANFSRTRVDLNQNLLTVTDAIREAQALAQSGSLIAGTYRCGYGIHFDVSGYTIYAGPDSSAVDCSTQDRNYDTSVGDVSVRVGFLANNVLEIVPPAGDIFFEPPNPTTYINGSNGAGVSAIIYIRRKGATCPSSDCRTVYVSTSGRIQTQ